MINVEKVLDLGHFDIPDPKSVWLYIAKLTDRNIGSKEHLDAVFQVVYILGKCLPEDTDIWVDFENEHPEGSIALISTTPYANTPITAVDYMRECIGDTAQAYWHIARIIILAFTHLHKV